MNTEQRLIRARIQLLLDKCFYGNLALALKLNKLDEIPTFATDGKSIFYNEEFTKGLSDRDLELVLCHEILHNIFYHFTRRGGREARRWNMATDYAVNSILKKEFGYLPEGALYNPQLEGMTAEAIYNKLPDLNKPSAQNSPSLGSGGQGEGQKEDNSGGEEGAEDKPKSKRGNSKSPSKTFRNSEFEIEIKGDGSIKVNGQKIKDYDSHKDIEGTPGEIDELEKDWKIQTTKSYEQSKIAGKLPGGMDIFIKDLLQPKLDYKSLLRQYINSIAKSDYSLLPPNRRYIHRGLYLPSLTSESLGDVVVVVDNSGSTIGFQRRFFSEINSILGQYDMNLHLIVVDTQVKDYRVLHKGEELPRSFRGGGGTDIRAAFDLIEEKYIRPSVVVCLTDGYTPFPNAPDYPTLWIITEGGDIDKVPFGEKVIIPISEGEEDD